MEEFTKTVKIPEERIPILIGKDGKIRKRAEEEFNVKIFINNDGVITLTSQDSLNLWMCEKFVKAIGRGFNPKKAFLLKKEDWDLVIIRISDYAHSSNDLRRLRGRVIGRKGKAKKMIENMTGSYISVYGKTVGVISSIGSIDIVRTAVTRLLEGAEHSTVFRHIKKMNQQRRRFY